MRHIAANCRLSLGPHAMFALWLQSHPDTPQLLSLEQLCRRSSRTALSDHIPCTSHNESAVHLRNQQSMKMIASTKLNRAQRAMAAAKAYGAANNGKFDRTSAPTSEHSIGIAKQFASPPPLSKRLQRSSPTLRLLPPRVAVSFLSLSPRTRVFVAASTRP